MTRTPLDSVTWCPIRESHSAFRSLILPFYFSHFPSLSHFIIMTYSLSAVLIPSLILSFSHSFSHSHYLALFLAHPLAHYLLL